MPRARRQRQTPRRRAGSPAGGLLLLLLLLLLPPPAAVSAAADDPASAELREARLRQGEVYVTGLDPAGRPGKGYRLEYMVAVPPEVYWRFKTDFAGDFLRTNPLIRAHRLVRRRGNVAVTETEYAVKPGVVFRWRTLLSPSRRRLDFRLLNPRECGQRFHYGHIRLAADDGRTRVTQEAYFDFFGASLWMRYPFWGGMVYDLSYTARWEQQTVLRLAERYR